MDTETIVSILRQGLYLVLMVSAGPMAAALVVGLFISILQATTQVQEQTLSYVPKIVAVSFSTGYPWSLDAERSRAVYANDPQLHPFGALMEMLRALQSILTSLGVHTNIQDFLMLFFSDLHPHRLSVKPHAVSWRKGSAWLRSRWGLQ